MTYDQIRTIESVCNAYAAANYSGFETVKDRVRRGIHDAETEVEKALDYVGIPAGTVELYLTAAYANLSRQKGRITMPGTCMKCDGCGMEVRLTTPGNHTGPAYAPDRATARAFGWQVPASEAAEGEHLCPVCLESKAMAEEMAQAAVAQSSLVLPAHVQQARHKPTPANKLSRLFQKPTPPSPEQQRNAMMEALTGHCKGAVAVVRDYLQVSAGMKLGFDGWTVLICPATALTAEAAPAPGLPRSGV